MPVSGIGISMMAGDTLYRRILVFFSLIETKILFIDLDCHFHHAARYILFRLIVAGKIQVMTGAIALIRRVAVITFHA